jgi:hypothetical protein
MQRGCPKHLLVLFEIFSRGCLLDRDRIIYSCSWAFSKSGIGDMDKLVYRPEG